MVMFRLVFAVFFLGVYGIDADLFIIFLESSEILARLRELTLRTYRSEIAS